MSNFRRIASGVGTVVTIIGMYKAQGVVAQYMKDNGHSSDNVMSGRIATVFVMSILIGSAIDRIINYSFDDG